MAYRDPYNHYTFIKEWKDLAQTICQNYDPLMKHEEWLEDQVNELINDSLLTDEKVKVMYEFVRDNIETDWSYTIWPGKSTKEVLEVGSGRLSEKNILLISLLNHAGLDAYPVLIGTRHYGIVRKNWPQLQ